MKNNCQPVKIHSRYDKQHQYSNLISYETCGHILVTSKDIHYTGLPMAGHMTPLYWCNLQAKK